MLHVISCSSYTTFVGGEMARGRNDLTPNKGRKIGLY